MVEVLHHMLMRMARDVMYETRRDDDVSYCQALNRLQAIHKPDEIYSGVAMIFL